MTWFPLVLSAVGTGATLQLQEVTQDLEARQIAADWGMNGDVTLGDLAPQKEVLSL